ncbi:MAG: type II secretion system protein [Planctomycetota bacterium]|jgi:prepilin-type N-terminal cleavage/methylation domain-containing protein
MLLFKSQKLFRRHCFKAAQPNGSVKSRAFTLIEVTLVVFIVAILAAVTIPVLRGRVDSAKWTEANAMADTIRTAVSTYACEASVATAQTNLVGNNLSDSSVQAALGFQPADLTGKYFVPGDYKISQINPKGTAEIIVTSSQTEAPAGTKTLGLDGTWQ